MFARKLLRVQVDLVGQRNLEVNDVTTNALQLLQREKA